MIMAQTRTHALEGFERLTWVFETEVELTSSGTVSRISFGVMCGVPAEAATYPDPPSERIPGLLYGGQRESFSSVPA